MSSQEIADMIFNFKDKLTDKEFKDVMDKLAIKKKDETDMYEVRYIKQVLKLTHGEGGGLYHKLLPKYKVKKVKLYDEEEGFKSVIDDIVMDIIANKTDYRLPNMDITKKNGEYMLIPSGQSVIWCNNPYEKKCNCSDCNSDDDDDDDRAKEKGAFIGFSRILITDIKKL